jgi:hypothetical protein
MFDTMNTDDDCVEGKTCGTTIAPLYFISFIVICSFIMLNLFILVILQQFDQYFLADDNVLKTFSGDVQTFKKSWTYFTRDDHCIKIKDNKLVEFFKHLDKPLGMTEGKDKDGNKIDIRDDHQDMHK